MDIKIKSILKGETTKDTEINESNVMQISAKLFADYDCVMFNHTVIGSTLITEVTVADPCDYESSSSMYDKIKKGFAPSEFKGEIIDMEVLIETQYESLEVEFKDGELPVR